MPFQPGERQAHHIAPQKRQSDDQGRRITAEGPVSTFDKSPERTRQVDRQSKKAYRDVLAQALTEQPSVRASEAGRGIRRRDGRA